MDSPMILVIDDSQTIRKLVECHLSQAGYRVAMASDAEQGLELARNLLPRLILLDHQLPGTTGDEVCRKLLECEETATIPVVVSSALRNRAFARYAEFPNVIDQIPKPFTPELLRSGVSNALQTGAMVVQAQRTGSAMPEAVGPAGETVLEGDLAVFRPRSLLDFLTLQEFRGRLSLELEHGRIRFALGGGKIQAVYSPTFDPDRLQSLLPDDLADLAPLLILTLGEREDPSMAGLVKLLEKSLNDPRRLRSLLRFQSALLAAWALDSTKGTFAADGVSILPPMFQAFPLQVSLAALAIEGTRHCRPKVDLQSSSKLVYARQIVRGGNPDRTGLSNLEVKIHTLLDGVRNLGEVANQSGIELAAVAATVAGLELAGHVERRSPAPENTILILDPDIETGRVVQDAFGAETAIITAKLVRDRVAAQLLLRRQTFRIVVLDMDRPGQESFFQTCKQQYASGTRFVGIAQIDDESQLARLDSMGLDGVLHRPLNESDLRATVNYLLLQDRSGMAVVA